MEKTSPHQDLHVIPEAADSTRASDALHYRLTVPKNTRQIMNILVTRPAERSAARPLARLFTAGVGEG